MKLENKMRILVTGASGFLGSHLIKFLLKKGIKTRGFYYFQDSISHFKGLNFEKFLGDIRRLKDIEDAMKDVDIVIHAAGNCSFLPKDRKVQFEVNVIGTQNTIKSAIKFKVKRFIHISSVNALGYPKEGEIGDETTPYNWSKFNIGYMESKRKAQEIALSALKDGLDVVVCNPTTMFGPEDVNMNTSKIIYTLSKVKDIMFYPPGGTNITDVKSVTEGIWQSIFYGEKGECYILGGKDVTYFELFSYILDKLGKKVKLIPIPYFVYLPLGIFLRILEYKLDFIPLTSDMVFGSSKKLYYSSKKAENILNYVPYDPFKAIDETILWLKEISSNLEPFHKYPHL